MPVTQILGKGQPARLNVLVVAEGFRLQEIGRFKARCGSVVAAIKAAPWYQRAPYLALWRADTEVQGNEPALGWPIPPCSPTAPPLPPVRFGASYGKDGVDRCLGGKDGDVLRLKLQLQSELRQSTPTFPGFDRVLVLVNSLIYGGSGLGTVAWSSITPGLYIPMALHELGHTFGLKDEYELECKVPRTASNSLKDFNISSDPVRPPWAKWIPPSAPKVTKGGRCETCDVPSPYPAAVVGAFEGAYYEHCGYFRPSHRCRMRDLKDPFCVICDMIIANVLDPKLPDAI